MLCAGAGVDGGKLADVFVSIGRGPRHGSGNFGNQVGEDALPGGLAQGQQLERGQHLVLAPTPRQAQRRIVRTDIPTDGG